MSEKREMLRHFLAALAYRTQKALRGAPADFGTFDAGHGVRRPIDLLRHMTSVLGYSRTFFIGGSYRPEPLPTLDDEIMRFHDMIEDLAARISTGETLNEISPEQLLQGPFSDAMTHAGQLAMLRRLASGPVASENFIFAAIDPNRLGPDQAEPKCPDKDWPGPL